MQPVVFSFKKFFQLKKFVHLKLIKHCKSTIIKIIKENCDKIRKIT